MERLDERRRARRPPRRARRVHGRISRLRSGGWETGAATAEFAMVLPVVVVMAALLLSLTRVVVVSMDCQDAAAAAAREAVLAGGEGDPVAVAKEAAGGSATVEISRADGAVTVTVGCPVLPGPLGVLPTRVTGTAVGVGQ